MWEHGAWGMGHGAWNLELGTVFLPITLLSLLIYNNSIVEFITVKIKVGINQF